MTKKFVVANPMTGCYTDAATEQERDALMAKAAWELYLSHTHNAPYSVVTAKEDGSEVWKGCDGSPMLSPAQIAAAIAEWNAQMATQQNGSAE
jgi:hypothetical protein